MSNLQNIQNVSVGRVRTLESVLPAWRLVLNKELGDLWIGGKALVIMLIYSILLGSMAYISSVNAALDMIPPKEAVSEMLWNAITVSTFLGLIIGADSISGERDRATLESFLLTSASRRHFIVAKLLAGVSTWPAAYIIVAPYLFVLSHGDKVLGTALIWGAIAGTVLVVGYTGLGMLISFWSSSNRVSYFVSLGIYALLLLPAELPGDTVEFVGQFLQWINPMAATNHFLSKHLVEQGAVNEFSIWLLSSLGLAGLSIVLLLGYVSNSLRLEAGTNLRFWAKLQRAIGLPVIAGLMMASLLVSPAYAFQGEQEGLVISINNDRHQVKMGDTIEVDTAITNNTSQASPPLIVALNVINLDDAGAAVDPEDWSPERTQYITPLESGQTATLDWIINPVMEGNFMVYLVLIPETADLETTTRPVASPGIHLTVTAFTELKKVAGVLPIMIGESILLLAITYFVYRRRRQQIDMGGPS